MARGVNFAYRVTLFLSILVYLSSTEFRIQLRRAFLALQYLVYCRCFSLNTGMASCARKGSVVLAVVVGSMARASANARVVIRSRGVGKVPGLEDSIKGRPPLAVLNSEAFLVRACPRSVVYENMVIALVSMASWKALIDVYEDFDEEVLMQGMSSM